MGKFAHQTDATVHEGVVLFHVETDGVSRQFEISSDVLREHFGATADSGSELLRAFEHARTEIEAVAQKVKGNPTEGPIELGTGDFNEGQA